MRLFNRKLNIALLVAAILLVTFYLLVSGLIIVVTSSGRVKGVSLENTREVQPLHKVGGIYFGIPNLEGQAALQCVASKKKPIAYVTKGSIQFHKVDC